MLRWIWRTTRRLAIAAALVAAYARFVEPGWIEVTRCTVELSIDRRDGTAPRPLRLAHLSDLHTRGLGAAERRLLQLLEREQPDAIVITGDTLCDDGTLDECRPLLERLRAPLGVFACIGNWEVEQARGAVARCFTECGVELLRNDGRELAPGIWLAGLEDAVFGMPDLARATAGAPEGDAIVALVHEPAWFDQVHGRCDLLLAGHTHGGQVRLPFLPPLYLPVGCGDYVEGLYCKAGRHLYVSRGIGMSGLRFRFLARPELALIELVPRG